MARHEPTLLPLFQRLFGTDPQAVNLRQSNPTRATGEQNEIYEGFRAVWDQAEGTHVPQPHAPAPTPVSSTGRGADDMIQEAGPEPGSAPGPRLALTSEDQGVYERAIGYLTELDADASRRVNAWAIERVAADHYVPVALEPTAEDHARQRLEADFVSLVAFTYGTRGAVAAEALSLRLAHDYGTRRTVQARGGAPGDATPVAVARMRYLQEAARFEEDLASYVAELDSVNDELGKMVRAVWDRAAADPQLRYRLGESFGTDDEETPGAVGRSTRAVRGVVEAGNLRERLAFLREGQLVSYVIADLLDFDFHRPSALKAERVDRVPAEPQLLFERYLRTVEASDWPDHEKLIARDYLRARFLSDIRAADVRPPLSRAERRLLGNDEILPWTPAKYRYAIREGGFRTRTESTGGLVWAGTSGAAYFLTNLAAVMNARWGLGLDLGLVRLGAIGTIRAQQHHTFHEVMRGAQLALDELPGHDPALDYVDNWSRYRYLAPLSEAELRSVANGGKFPHEHAMEMLQTSGGAGTTGPQSDGGKGKARVDGPVRLPDDAPEGVREEYVAALAHRAQAVADFADAALAPETGEGTSHATRLTSARARLDEAERRLTEVTGKLADVGLDVTLREPIGADMSDIGSAMSGLSLESGPGLRSFPAPESWNGSGSGWGRDVVLRRDMGDGGRSHGLAYFSDADWVSRSGSFGQLPRLTHVAVWGEGGRGLPEVLPVPGGVAGERFFFARHGRAGGLSRAEGRELAVEAAASGFRDVYLLPCYSPGVAGSRPEVDLGEWAREHGRTVHEALGRSAVTESSDGRFGPVLWHVALDGTDGASAIRSFRPDGTVVETRAGSGVRSRGIPFPADVLWNVPPQNVPPQVGGPVASAPRTIPRFPFYGTSEWERATREYEKAVATAIAKVDNVLATVKDGIERLFIRLDGLDDNPGFDDFSLARQRLQQQADPTLSDLMEVFTLGADVFVDEGELSDSETGRGTVGRRSRREPRRRTGAAAAWLPSRRGRRRGQASSARL
ncbi:hypothetical protein RKD19_004898 [Streptomyces canus]